MITAKEAREIQVKAILKNIEDNLSVQKWLELIEHEIIKMAHQGFNKVYVDLPVIESADADKWHRNLIALTHILTSSNIGFSKLQAGYREKTRDYWVEFEF